MEKLVIGLSHFWHVHMVMWLGPTPCKLAQHWADDVPTCADLD
jgi:hypothetical protein